MTPLPKRKHSTRRKGKRRAAINLVAIQVIRCPRCGLAKLSHLACPKCGFYKDRLIFKK